jgi:hypothetical protein
MVECCVIGMEFADIQQEVSYSAGVGHLKAKSANSKTSV